MENKAHNCCILRGTESWCMHLHCAASKWGLYDLEETTPVRQCLIDDVTWVGESNDDGNYFFNLLDLMRQ